MMAFQGQHDFDDGILGTLFFMMALNQEPMILMMPFQGQHDFDVVILGTHDFGNGCTRRSQYLLLLRLQPLLVEAGGNISHWFDATTQDVKTSIDPVTKLPTYDTPQVCICRS